VTGGMKHQPNPSAPPNVKRSIARAPPAGAQGYCQRRGGGACGIDWR
jgi:hypothetical protein